MSETSAPEARSDAPFTLRDVLADALTCLLVDWPAHLGWNVIWVGVALVTCCGTSMALAAAMALFRVGTEDSPDAMLGLVGVFYALLLPILFGLYAVHQSVTLVLTRSRARGAPVSMREAIVQGLRRTPALVGHVIARAFVEGIPIVTIYVIVLGVLFASGARLGDASGLGALAWATIGVGYVIVLAIGFGARMWLGLAFPCVVIDGVGPIAAFGASSRLLAGRRWQFLRFRLAVLAGWLLAYGVCMGPWFALMGRGGAPDPRATLLVLPLMLLFYVVVLFLVVLDAALEACFHERVTRPLDAAALARTFE